MFDDLRFSRYSAKATQGRYMTTIRRASFVIVLALATIRLASCQNKAPFDPGLAGAFFPLNPGSTWTYRVVDKNLGTTNIITDRAMDKQLISSVNYRCLSGLRRFTFPRRPHVHDLLSARRRRQRP